MKKIFLVFVLIIVANSLFAQFAGKEQLKQYIENVIKDKRPEKITAADLQKVLLGIIDVMDSLKIGKIDSTTRNDDTIALWNNGQAVIQFKDSSFNQPLLPAKMVPFVGTDGKLTYSSNLSWDGTNLTAGNGGFYSSSGLLLNGGRAFLGASGWGADFYAPTGGRNSDPSKHIKFWNADRWYLDLNLPDAGSTQTDVMQGTAQMNWIPYLSDSFNIGAPSKRWKNGYFKNIYINGALFNPDLAGSYVPLTDKATANGIATLDGTGKVPLAQLPAITVNKPTYVQTLAEMLANDSASVGDIEVVGDSSKSYALMQLPSSSLSNWLELQSPIPTNTDLLPEGTTNKYYTDAKTRNAISGTGRVTYNNTTGAIGVTAPDWDVPGDIINKPAIPEEFNPSEGQHIAISGTYPNLLFETKRIYDSLQIDSIANKLRSEIQIAANGGVTISQVDSAVNSQITAGNYQTKTIADAAYKPISYVPAWSEITGRPTLFSGSYTDLTNKPTIPTVPTNVSSFTNDAGFITSAAIAGKQDIIPNLSDTSKYLKKIDTTGKWISPAVANATYATITALNLKAPLASPSFTGVVNSSTYFQSGNGYGFNFGGTSTKIIGASSSNYMEFYTNNVKKFAINTNVLVNGAIDNGVDALQVNGSLLGNSFKKFGGTSSQFLKADGSTDNNSYATITRLQDSITVLNGKLAAKRDTSFYQNLYGSYPIQFPNDSTFGIAQSWKDTVAYKVDVWPLAGSAVTNSLNKYLGYSVADSLIFKVKNAFAGIIDSTNHNAGFGYLGFTNSGANLSGGMYNTWLGNGAGGGGHTYSSDGVFIGSLAHTSIDSSHYVIAIGSDAVATKSYQTVIGTPNTLETKLFGTILSNTDTLAKKIDLVNYATKADLKNVSGALKDRDFANDSIAFVDGHLNQWDLYRTGGSVKVLTTLPYDTSKFNFIIDNRDGSSANLKLRLTTYAASLTATIYWGDGDSTVLAGDSAVYHPVHTYATAGYYIAKIKLPIITDLRELYMNDVTTPNIKIAGFYGISKLTNLGIFSANYSSLTSTIVDAIQYPASLYSLNLTGNALTGFNPAYPPALTTLTLQSNNIPSTTAIYLPPTITSLNIRTQAIDGNTWVSSDVNNMLQYIDSKTFNAGAKTLDIRQFNTAPPTGAGLTAKTNLTSEEWTVTTD